MGFKDQVQQDVLRTFLSDLEFAEVKTVDGQQMHVVIDDYALVGRTAGGDTHTDGVYQAQILLYVAASEYGPKPKQNKLITVGSKDYRIVKVEEDAGIYTFTLEANRT